MTILVICKDKDGWVLGSDRQQSNGNLKELTTKPKIFSKKVETIDKDNQIIKTENLWIGFTGYSRVGFYMYHNFKFGQKMEEDSYVKYLYKELRKFKSSLDDYGLMREKEKLSDSGTWSIILLDNHVYSIDNNMGITENREDYYADGCATDLALGSLYTSKGSGYDAEGRVKLALECANYHDCYCNDHYDIVKVDKRGECVKE